MRWLLLTLLCLGIGACGSKKAERADDESGEESEDSAKKKKKKKKASASAGASPTASGSASVASTTSAAATTSSDAPLPLAKLFDGGADLPNSTEERVGPATLRLPPSWKGSGGWESVDAYRGGGGAAVVVMLHVGVKAAYLDSNVATWIKAPFENPEKEVLWEPRTLGKVGPDHLEGQIAKGSGPFFNEPADYWQAALGFDGKVYPLVVIAGVKKSAPQAAREELFAVVRSVRLKKK